MMAINKPGESGPAFGRSPTPYKPAPVPPGTAIDPANPKDGPRVTPPVNAAPEVKKTAANITPPGPNFESQKTPRNTAVDAATQPSPTTGAATTPLGKKLQPPGAPNVGREGMPPDPIPNPHIPSSEIGGGTVIVPGAGPGQAPPDDDQDAEDEAERLAEENEDIPHPEHVAGKVAVKNFEAKRAAELEAGQRAVANPHRRK